MKNIILLFMLSIVVAVFLSGCGETSIEPVDGDTLTDEGQEVGDEGKEIKDEGEKEEEPESESSEEDTEIGTRSKPLTIGERISLQYNDFFDGDVHLEMELLEVISGDEAWGMVKEGNSFNDEPGENQEYVLAKFYVKVLEVENEPFDLNHAQFDAVSESGNAYDEFLSVSGLEPNLSNEMYEGAEREGYTYFLIDQDDENPLIAFKRRSDGEVWFELK
ncbi:hypothetical protein [Bacillus sp. JCM 19034]|uniref:hypothetical protein n=1 Tax=Bacillus sp. JCM 19034 TaxID=1481928 RepID=UPI00078414D3|nr:hypothetical protein [Bacillus sp. JCM 19034]